MLMDLPMETQDIQDTQITPDLSWKLVDRECDYPECKSTYRAVRKKQRFCTPRCRDLYWMSRRQLVDKDKLMLLERLARELSGTTVG